MLLKQFTGRKASKDASGKDDKPLADEEEAEEQKEPVPSQASQPDPVTWESLGEQKKFFNFDILPKVNIGAYSSLCCILFIYSQLLLARGSMVNLLSSSTVSKYLEFRATTAILQCNEGQLGQVAITS